MALTNPPLLQKERLKQLEIYDVEQMKSGGSTATPITQAFDPPVQAKKIEGQLAQSSTHTTLLYVVTEDGKFIPYELNPGGSFVLDELTNVAGLRVGSVRAEASEDYFSYAQIKVWS
ncbi:MAG: hypothetical protein ACFB9N_05080 [Geitlerinemataceae cyanobacterium]